MAISARESAQRDILAALRAGGIVAVESAGRRGPKYARFAETRRVRAWIGVRVLDEAETARRCGWGWYAPQAIDAPGVSGVH